MTSGPRDRAFIKNLIDTTVGDGAPARATRAALRRGLGKEPGEAPEMFRYVVPWLGTNPRRSDEQAYYLVASLFAAHPVPWRGDARRTNVGASMQWVGRQRSSSEAVERRFVALLNAGADDLGDHLRHAVSLCRAEEVPINWLQLLADVCDWNREGREVQRRWAGAFWSPSEPSDDPMAQESADQSTPTAAE